MKTKKPAVDISLVLPAYNEEENILLLYESIKSVEEPCEARKIHKIVYTITR